MIVSEIQKLFDAGFSLAEISRRMGVHHTTLRRFVDRNGIEIYIAHDELFYNVPSHHVILSCFYINNSYKVCADESRLQDISSNCGVKVSSLKRTVRNYLRELELEALDLFVRSFDFDEVNNEAISEHRYIVSYIYNSFKGFDEFRKCFGISEDLVRYSSDGLRSWYIHKGIEFESLLGKALMKVYGGDLILNARISNCEPDFILNGMWVDAKLSKSTALSPSDTTIPKYLEHTDRLTIVYAFDDGADTSEVESLYNVKFTHVSRFYDLFDEVSVRGIEELIRNVSALKRISA